jgi:hypothetical protein
MLLEVILLILLKNIIQGEAGIKYGKGFFRNGSAFLS